MGRCAGGFAEGPARGKFSQRTLPPVKQTTRVTSTGLCARLIHSLTHLREPGNLPACVKQQLWAAREGTKRREHAKGISDVAGSFTSCCHVYFHVGTHKQTKVRVMISPRFRRPLRVSPSLLCPASGPEPSIPAARKPSLSPDVPSRAPGLGLGVRGRDSSQDRVGPWLTPTPQPEVCPQGQVWVCSSETLS